MVRTRAHVRTTGDCACTPSRWFGSKGRDDRCTSGRPPARAQCPVLLQLLKPLHTPPGPTPQTKAIAVGLAALLTCATAWVHGWDSVGKQLWVDFFSRPNLPSPAQQEFVANTYAIVRCAA